MNIGCCTDIQNAKLVKEAGFDFLECKVVSLMEEQTDIIEQQAQFCQEIKLPVMSCNIFLPGTLKVVGNEVDEAAIAGYLETAMPRIKQIGAETIVFGSGGSRSIPEGFSRQKGEEQIGHFLDLAADYAEPLGLSIVIEPLNQLESNMINSIPEAVRFAKSVNRRSIQVLADFYHMEIEKEPLDNIITAKEYLKHVHVADTDRKPPGTGSYPYHKFKECLTAAGYDGSIAVECNWSNLSGELHAARKYLTEVFACPS
ncbi:sugar phosphate isomerase/epimerase family protein [Sediminibacillus halophilus]|uniref:Sugar phosphate isomerase/epimerase n=1 Tax=Sediminibacillus halophilus TaxID=482461 RepID=A0A1G9NM01_9BACI|nr:sugar phosphate isomerase/epimerase family protein [Sediminibacillus halophilus]SDL87409.1 Sugar phosphate isomerase/epimerase [Sediminibacillus halophilus]